VLGFTAGELKSLVFNENFFISSFGIVAGMPLGSYCARLAIESQCNDNFRMSPSVNPSSYLIAALMVMAFTVIANYMLKNKITSINMVESLKSAE
jgi:putative ABC transport system permease protein